ncbi:MAG: Modification methylase [candidate division WS6 bacterium GW2011_GWF1_35_23]|uniref:Methyltransferase n=1 Tax=candidate division WS6 bacterium GW2011_GWF1_35_23 TaxID=1619097 RepID=A0A0G0BZU9_9BACT|nr:MAG: Modification methylase [candidate division WS6 bacterium GW2011_GWF1_35_23]
MIFLNCDCMIGMKEYPDKHFDLAIVDPPYGIGYSALVGSKKESDGWKRRDKKNWDSNVPDKNYFDELFRVSKNQIIWGGNYFNLSPSRCYLIWDKVQRIDQADCELAWTSLNGSARIFSYARGNESGFAPKLKGSAKDFANIHPTQKPIALYKWILSKYAKPNDKILDTHVGSASSLIACEDMGFDYVGFELDKDYYESATKRILQYRSQLKLAI